MEAQPVIRVDVVALMHDHARLHNANLQLEAELKRLKEELNRKILSENQQIQKCQQLEADQRKTSGSLTFLQQQTRQQSQEINGLKQHNGMLKSRLEMAEKNYEKALKFMQFHGVAESFHQALAGDSFIPQQIVQTQHLQHPQQAMPFVPVKNLQQVDSGFCGSGTYQQQAQGVPFLVTQAQSWTFMAPPPNVMPQLQFAPMSYNVVPPVQEGMPSTDTQHEETVIDVPSGSGTNTQYDEPEEISGAIIPPPPQVQYIVDTTDPSFYSCEPLFDFGADTPADFE